MPSFSAPFYGNITNLTVDPIDNSLWLISKHPNGRSIAPTQIFVQNLIESKRPNNCVQTSHFDGIATSAYGHATGLYVLAKDGKVYRRDTSNMRQDNTQALPKANFTMCMDLGEDFGLQGITGFVDGRASFPKSDAVEDDTKIPNICQKQGKHNNKLLLVGSSQAIVVEVADGSLTKVHTFSCNKGKDSQITSFAAETVFSSKEGQKTTHHCAFGYENGHIDLYFTSDDSNNFDEAKLYNADEVELEGSLSLHEDRVQALLYVRDLDRYGMENRYIMSTGIDAKTYQISLKENIAIQRKPDRGHKSPIRSFVAGAFTNVSSIQDTGRFYSLGIDNTVKVWLNGYSSVAVSTYKAEMRLDAGCIIILPMIHKKGPYSQGAYMGKKMPTPHLVVAGKEKLQIIPIIKYDRGDTKLPKDLDNNGRLESMPTVEVTGGLSYVLQYGIQSDNPQVRHASLEHFKTWDELWVVDKLYEIASNTDYDIAYQKSALEALKTTSHPRRIICLEDLLHSYNPEKIQEMAYVSLKEIFEHSPRPFQLALKKSSENVVLKVVADLADIARGNSPLQREALEILQGIINHKEYNIAKRAYNYICGEIEMEGKREDAVISGVEGVLYGIYSNRTDIRREMALILAKRDLVHAFETTLILRRLLESNDETIRERALDVSLLRAPAVASILRKNPDNADLHQRLYVLTEGSLGSDEQKNKDILFQALPTDEEIEAYELAFQKEDPSIEHDLDILVELTSCSQDDISIYALLVKAMLGYEGAVQGLLQLSNHSNEKILRLATIGLGYFVHLDDAFQRLCGLTLSKNTPPRVGNVSIYHAIHGYDHRQEDPVQNILHKVLDSGNSELRKTALTIGQDRINKRLKKIQKLKTQDKNAPKAPTDHKMEDLLANLKKAQAGLAHAVKSGNDYVKELLQDQIIELEQKLEGFSNKTRNLSDELKSLAEEKELIKIGLKEETIDMRIRKEAYKSFLEHNLEDSKLSSNKTPTLKMLLNLRDGTLFRESLKDLLSFLDNVECRDWALQLFKKLINQDIKPAHHSNVWNIWTQGANWSNDKDYQSQILRIGFECKIPCDCRTHTNGTYHVCIRHQIRRDAFLRVLSASGDWLADFIREALDSSKKKDRSAGVNVGAIVLGDKGKQAVDNLDDPESFIFSLFDDKKSSKNIGYACELLQMFPKHYSKRIQQQMFSLRNESSILKAISAEYRLLTERFYNFYIEKVTEGRDEMFTKNIERYAAEHGFLEDLMPILLDSDNGRLIAKALELASDNYDTWGKVILETALEESDERKAKRAFGLIKAKLERIALRKKNDDELKTFIVDYFNNVPVHQQTWVLESIRISKNTPSWIEELITTSSTHKADVIRQKAFQLIQGTQSKDPWMVDILKTGLTDPNSAISSAAFQGLLLVNKLLGPAEEKKFLTDAMRKNEEHRKQAIAEGLQTTASWRVEFILEALNDEDHMIRSYMCEKLRSTSGLSDDFYQGLLDHKDLEVRQLAQEVLAARGLYRPSAKLDSDNLEDTILEAPPPMPLGWFGWISWYWRVQAWKNRKIKAIIAAGKTHDPHYYDVFRKLLSNFGFHAKISELWRNAMRYTSWWYQDWWEFIVLEMGWVLSEKNIKEAKTEANKQRDNRIRVAWNIACNRYGDKETLKWTINQYYDNGWRNQYKTYIKREYLFEGLFSVNSFVGFDAKSEGEAFSIMQRLMNDDTSFANDLFRLNMLRLSEQGGPVDYIGIGYTCTNDQTVLESVLMRENQHNKKGLLDALLELLNKQDIPEKDPYALSNIGGVWYDVVRLTLELNMKTYDLSSTIAPEYWRRIGRMISCHHPQLRARAVRCYFRRHVYGEEKERFQADVENFSRQLSSTTVDAFDLMQDGKGIDEKQSVDLAFDGYIGLIRKQQFSGEYRRDAIRYVVSMCSGLEDARRVVPILKSALTLEKSKLRFEAYRQMIAIQAKDHSLIKLDQLIQMGLRSTDTRLKKMAISLIWCTDQLEHTEKISRLEAILSHMNDVSAEYAFELLYAVAGRPAAWDQADATKKQDEGTAKQTYDSALEGFNSEIQKIRDNFESFKEGFRAAPNSDGQDQSILDNRRSVMLKQIEELEDQKREANSKYELDLHQAVENHKSSMDAPLTEADKQTWADAIARRDQLIGMAIHGYYPDLRNAAVDKGLQECARRRIYFENKQEEFAGYFERLLGIVEQGLQSPYSDLVQHTAVSMARKYFIGAYRVLLQYLASHDPNLQELGIEGLVQYGPLGLTDFVDEQGNTYPRTSIIFLNRLRYDEFGTIDQNSIFQAISQLKDSHSTVVDALFSYLDRGPEDRDYTTVLSTLIDISGCNKPILRNVRWADLTPSDYSSLQQYLSHELDWEQVSLDDFITYYQDVYDEVLLARIIENLYQRNDYQNIRNFSLLNHCKYTKGFDIWKHVQDGVVTKQPIDRILRKIALLPIDELTEQIRTQAINALIHRLEHREMWYIPAQEATKNDSVLVSAIVDVVEATQDDITYELLKLTKSLAYAGLHNKSNAIFNTLYSIATVQKYEVTWRTQAMKALGQLSDERAVVALLNAAGFDAYGEALIIDPNLPTLTEQEKEQLQISAAEGLGGMIFAQEKEGIYQLLSNMTRSKNQRVRQNGFTGLRYFSRSEKYALEVTGIFAARLQSAVNANNFQNTRFFLKLFAQLLDPVQDEDAPKNEEYVINSITKENVKEYILQTLFGEVFELDGEAFNPLSVENNLFEMNNQEYLELAFQTVRQLVHGPYQNVNQASDDKNSDEEIQEVPIDYSYLSSKTPEERTKALKAEILLFKNKTATKYSIDVAKEMALYLSDREIFDLIEDAYKHNFESETKSTIARYNILLQNIMFRTPAPIGLAFDLLRYDYAIDVFGSIVSHSYKVASLPVLRSNLNVLATKMPLFEEHLKWYYEQFKMYIEDIRFGSGKHDTCSAFFDILKKLLSIYESLPNVSSITLIIENLLNNIYYMNHSQNIYRELFEAYIKSGSLNWDFVHTVLKEQHRSLRDTFINHLTIELVQDMTPSILEWIVTDQSAVLRLIDVLASQKDDIQKQVLTNLKDTAQPNTVLLVLAKLNSVPAFTTLIDSYRDDDGAISDEKGLRSKKAPRSTEGSDKNTYTPITVDVLCQGLSMIATEEAEYYLRDLAEDSKLGYGLRQAISRSAKVAHRRRVPIHIRRIQRQQS